MIVKKSTTKKEYDKLPDEEEIIHIGEDPLYYKRLSDTLTKSESLKNKKLRMNLLWLGYSIGIFVASIVSLVLIIIGYNLIELTFFFGEIGITFFILLTFSLLKYLNNKEETQHG